MEYAVFFRVLSYECFVGSCCRYDLNSFVFLDEFDVVQSFVIRITSSCVDLLSVCKDGVNPVARHAVPD